MNIAESILRAATSVTSLLADGADSVRTLRERQSEKVPYIVVNQDLIDPNDSQSGQSIDQWNVVVTIVGDRLYTDGANIGVYNIGQLVRTALHDSNGTIAGFEVANVVFDSQSNQLFQSTNEKRVVIDQEYTMYVRR